MKNVQIAALSVLAEILSMNDTTTNTTTTTVDHDTVATLKNCIGCYPFDPNAENYYFGVVFRDGYWQVVKLSGSDRLGSTLGVYFDTKENRNNAVDLVGHDAIIAISLQQAGVSPL